MSTILGLLYLVIDEFSSSFTKPFLVILRSLKSNIAYKLCEARFWTTVNQVSLLGGIEAIDKISFHQTERRLGGLVIHARHYRGNKSCLGKGFWVQSAVLA